MTLTQALAAIDACFECRTLADLAARLGVDRETARNTKAILKRRGCKGLPNYSTGNTIGKPGMSAADWTEAIRYCRKKADEIAARRYRERLVG